jgi:hypothetical protein
VVRRCRLYDHLAAGAIVCAGPDDFAAECAHALGLPLVRNAGTPLRKFAGRNDFIALVRPDHILGWIGDTHRNEQTQTAMRSALGRH